MFRVLAAIALATLLVAPIDAQTQTDPPARTPRPAQQAKPKPTVIVNVNTATTSELEQLPGIGPRTAARIIEYRQKKGLFKKPEELMNVQGIGEKSFLKLKPLVTTSTKTDLASAQQN